MAEVGCLLSVGMRPVLFAHGQERSLLKQFDNHREEAPGHRD